jgi:hypothetical protein
LEPAKLRITMKLNLLKENSMAKERTTLQIFRKSFLPALALAAFLAACTPAQPNLQQVQSLVQTSVASTMEAQNQVGTLVAQTVEAQQPATETPTIMLTASPFPTLTPIIPVIATATTASTGGGGYVAPVAWSCDPDIDKRPLDSNPAYARGDHFEIKWTLLNNGTQTWPAGYDLTWFSVQPSGPQISTTTGPIQLPQVKPGNTFTVPTLEGIAPNQPGTYILTWKLQGGWCYPYIIVRVK